MGRKDKLTPGMQKNIFTAIRSGMRLSKACALCGITTNTYYSWEESGQVEAQRIKIELEQLKKEAKQNGTFPKSYDKQETWIDKKINELKPNKFFNFFLEIKQQEAKHELDNLNAILHARDGGEYIAETIIEKTAKGKVKKITEVKKHLKPNWKAAKYLLYVNDKEHYADRQILSHEGEIENKSTHEVNHNITIDESPDRVAEVLSILIKSGALESRLKEDFKSEPKLIEVGDTKDK